ncbi:MAG: hypothetical protein D6701_02440 [Gemmatimonadetes bacterium]|nr:MAG: hypothetical protein D6701_02440 [Gemmatimonadota bacterium]
MLLGVLSALVAAACSGDDSTGPTANPDFMVGDWIAVDMRITSVANPEVRADVIASGGEFTLNVQPSGRYTAILQAFGQASTETGTVTVEGNQVVFMRTFPTQEESRATWSRNGANVVLDGPTRFDFNLDGTPEDGTLHMELAPR